MAHPDEDSTSEPPGRQLQEEVSWLEKQFINSSYLSLILLPLCCGPVGFLIGLLGVITCRDPRSRKNALILLVVGLLAWPIVMTLYYMAERTTPKNVFQQHSTSKSVFQP
jgi:hypothetical protein